MNEQALVAKVWTIAPPMADGGFPPWPTHRPIAVGFAEARQRGGEWIFGIDALVVTGDTVEADLIRATDQRMAKVDTVTSFNGAQFDALVLRLAAQRCRLWGLKALRKRSLSHIEGCVLQLAAAINDTPGQTAQFKPLQAKVVAASPQYRADVPMIAAMFRYCLQPQGTAKERVQRVKERASLLAYLRAAVATWARPEELLDLGPGQWTSAAQVLDLNPPGRRQTRKYRGVIPIPPKFAPFLDGLAGPYLPAWPRSSWERMRQEIGLPSGRGEAGAKLIRRSMATLARKRIGEADWRQGEMMLGHVKASISDIYAIPDPANLGLALAATTAIIDEICALVPGAYTPPHRSFTES